MRTRPPLSPTKRLTCALAATALLLPLSVGAEGPAIVRVDMREFTFRPATIHLAAGRPVKLVLVNQGQIAHQFETTYLRSLPVRIVGESVYTEAAGLDLIRLDPGRTARLEFLPRRTGRFVFACTLEGHKESGMQGTLDVR